MDNGIQFARVDFRNDECVFGIKDEDRFSHIDIIGKTGTGKSTMLETMALQDLQRNNGFALIDPQGDLVDRVARISEKCRDDVIYLNVPDPAQPYGYNPLRHVREDRIALAASRMMDVFKRCGPTHGACAWSTFSAMCSWRFWSSRMRRFTMCCASFSTRNFAIGSSSRFGTKLFGHSYCTNLSDFPSAIVLTVQRRSKTRLEHFSLILFSIGF